MDSPPIRLLMTADAVGGVWQYATELAAGLSGHGIETTIAVLGPAPSDGQRDAARGVALVETGLPLDWLSDAPATAAAAGEVAAMARHLRADIVHLNSPALAAGQAFGQQAFGVPVVGAAHGCLATWWQAAHPSQPLDPQLRWHEEMMARGLRACDRVIAPSAAFAEAVRQVYRLPAAPAVVHNGRSMARCGAALAQQDCALTAGRLWDAVKNTPVLDEVAARLPFPFHAAGPATAPHGETVRTEHLHLLGMLPAEELARRLARRPVFVSAATFEPFGLAVLEAAASGCPLVLSDIATFRELWDGAAVFVSPHDVPGFAAAIEEAVQDLALRAALGEAARARAAAFGAERMAAATAAHYRTLLQARLAA